MQRNTLLLTIAAAALLAVAAIGFLVGRSSVNATNPTNGIAGARSVAYWRAPMDPTEIYDAPGQSRMGMDLVPVYEDELNGSDTGSLGGSGMIQRNGEDNQDNVIVIDPAVTQNMGVRTAPVERTDFTRTIRTVGKVDYDEEELQVASTRISGWIEKLYIDFVGQEVKAGAPLLQIYSPELVSTQQEYLLAFRNNERAKGSTLASVRDDAARLLASTRQRLEYWQIPSSVVDSLEATGHVQRTVTLRSPASGVVIRKEAVEGAYVKAGEDLFEIADLSSVWVHASVYDDELPWLKEGQVAIMDLSYLPGREFRGRVAYVYPYLRDKARDAHARIVFQNPELELKPGMYVNIRMEGTAITNALVVPLEAVIRSGARSIAFVQHSEGRFEPREIQIGQEGGENNTLVHVLSGLNEGEQVVTSAQFMLDSESRLQEAIRKLLAGRVASAPGPTSTDNSQTEQPQEHQMPSREGAMDSRSSSGMETVDSMDSMDSMDHSQHNMTNDGQAPAIIPTVMPDSTGATGTIKPDSTGATGRVKPDSSTAKKTTTKPHEH